MSVIVVPASTSYLQATRGPTVVAVSSGSAGLTKPTAIVCHQITTLERSKIGKRIGSLSDELLEAVDRGLLAAMDLHR